MYPIAVNTAMEERCISRINDRQYSQRTRVQHSALDCADEEQRTSVGYSCSAYPMIRKPISSLGILYPRHAIILKIMKCKITASQPCGLPAKHQMGSSWAADGRWGSSAMNFIVLPRSLANSASLHVGPTRLKNEQFLQTK